MPIPRSSSQTNPYEFTKKARAEVAETTLHQKLAMEGPTTHFFPTNALQLQKSYLPQSLFKPHEFKIREFIFYVNEII